MLRKLIIASAILVATPAFAQQAAPNPDVIIRELSKRRGEEMQKAILCEVGKHNLQKEIDKLKADLEAAKKQKEEAPPK
jgi:hypothetical protein